MTVVLADALRFAELMLKFQEVIRKVSIPRRPMQNENDVEHSYQLAMMAWYINQAGNLGLDVALLLMYALTHDLHETIAGDFHVLDHAGRIGKAEREAAALEQIAQEFPEFPQMIEIIQRYESQSDEESKFVYALDKLMPMLIIYLEGGSSWREVNISMEELFANKAEKTARSSTIFALSNELEVLLRARPQLFPRP